MRGAAFFFSKSQDSCVCRHLEEPRDDASVMTQVWITMCAYLLLAWIKFLSRIELSLQQMLRLLQLNLFDRRDLIQLSKGDPPNRPTIPCKHA
jgi:hypothetical protein